MAREIGVRAGSVALILFPGHFSPVTIVLSMSRNVFHYRRRIRYPQRAAAAAAVIPVSAQCLLEQFNPHNLPFAANRLRPE